MLSGVLTASIAHTEQLLAAGVMCSTTGVLAGVLAFGLSRCVTSLSVATTTGARADGGGLGIDGDSEVTIETLGLLSGGTATAPARAVRFAYVDAGPVPLMSVRVDGGATGYFDLQNGKVDNDTMLAINTVARDHRRQDEQQQEGGDGD